MKNLANPLRLGAIPLVLVCCRRTEVDSTEEQILETHTIGEADYRVYGAVLSDLVESLPDDPVRGPHTRLVLYDTTGLGHPYGIDPGYEAATIVQQLEDQIPQEASSVVERFVGANRSTHRLGNRFEGPLSVALITKDSARYPGDLVLDVSAVGFAPDTTYALVYAGITRSLTCGEGYLYLLRRERNTWLIVAKEMVWIS